MRSSQFLVAGLVAAAIILSTVCCVAPDEGTAVPASTFAAEKSAMEETSRKYEQAYAAADAATLASLYTEGAILLPDDAEMVRGRQAIREFFSAGMGSGATIKFTTLQIEGEGDLAFEVGRYDYSVQPEGQDAQESSGKYVVVWRKGTDGVWRAHVDIWNQTPQAPTT